MLLVILIIISVVIMIIGIIRWNKKEKFTFPSFTHPMATAIRSFSQSYYTPQRGGFTKADEKFYGIMKELRLFLGYQLGEEYIYRHERTFDENALNILKSDMLIPYIMEVASFSSELMRKYYCAYKIAKEFAIKHKLYAKGDITDIVKFLLSDDTLPCSKIKVNDGESSFNMMYYGMVSEILPNITVNSDKTIDFDRKFFDTIETQMIDEYNGIPKIESRKKQFLHFVDNFIKRRLEGNVDRYKYIA